MFALAVAALASLAVVEQVEQVESEWPWDHNHWAVLVAGSSGYGNYRHQADVCHAYQIVKKAGKTSYAMAQRNTVGGGSGAVTGLLNEIVGTLLTPTQLAFIGLWVVLILKYLIFY